MLAGFLTLAAALCGTAALAQVPDLRTPGVPPPAQPELPAFPQTAAPTGVVADPNRVFGDDAPDVGGFDVLAGIGFNASAGLVTEWNDNVARQPSGAPLNRRFVSRSDFRFSPSLSVDAGRAIGRQRVFVSASVGRDFFARNTVLNQNRISANGGLQWSLGTRCNGRFQGSYTDRTARFGDFVEIVPATQETIGFLAAAGCATATGLGFNASYNNTRNRNSALVREFADSNAAGVNGSIFYRLGSRGDITLSGSSQKVTFPNQFQPDGQTSGLDLQSVTVGVGYRFGPSIRFNGSLGNSWVDPTNPLTPNFSGATFNIGLNYSGPRLGAQVSGGRGVSSGGGQGFANFQVSDQFQASVNYTLGQRISLSTGFAWIDQQNRGLDGIPEAQRLDGFSQTRYFLGADYRLNRIFSMGFDVNRQNRSSGDQIFDFDNNSVLLTLRARI